MWACSWPGAGGRPVCVHGQEKLAERLGVDARTVRRLIADLREPGIDPRHPHVKPVGLRLGWLLVRPRARPGGRGGILYGANRYVLQLDLGDLDDLEAQMRSSRSDRRDTPPPESNRTDTPEAPVLAGQTGQIGGTGEPVSLSHVQQGGRDTYPGCDDRAPLRFVASDYAARSADDNPSRDWREVLGQTHPDDGERFGSREEEEQEKRRRAEQLLARLDSAPAPESPCADCPKEAAG